MSNSALLFFTHVDDPRVRRHFAKIKQDLAGIMPVFFVYQYDEIVPDFVVDIQIGEGDIEAYFPRRSSERIVEKRRINSGYYDTVFMTAAMNPLLDDFDYIWCVEYDVDYTGNWTDLFSQIDNHEKEECYDLIACCFGTYLDSPDFTHWQYSKIPPDLHSNDREFDHRRNCFMPISKLSKTFVRKYIEIVNQDYWFGHFEILIPTIASLYGFSSFDLMKTVPQVMNDRTFGYRPVRSEVYYAENRLGPSWEEGVLYHPVKVI